MAYHRVHGLKTRIVRIFNTYGPRMRVEDGRVVPNFCMQALKGEDLTIYGDGKQTRSFCYVDRIWWKEDLRILASGHVEPINLGDPDEYTILDFAEQIRKISGSQAKLLFRPLPQDDPAHSSPGYYQGAYSAGVAAARESGDGTAKNFRVFQSTAHSVGWT